MKLFNLLCAVAGLGLQVAVTAPSNAGPASNPRLTVRDGTTYHTFEDKATGARMDIVKNSGVCETTPGVNQYSGYLSVGNDMNMFFWFFEARNNPTTAPLAMWLNGGPGCSSLIGLFQENGPCHFVGGSAQPSLNPNSWNEYANMLYVDQPIGTGFSYGRDPVTSTVTAAPYVWTLLQAFFNNLPQYESRDFGLFTESYGGHYGPEFAEYFEEQNAAIVGGSVKGEKINLVALGINNGWFDPILQFKAYIDYAYSNPYRRLISASQRDRFTTYYNQKCLPELQQCTAVSGQNTKCVAADNDCNELYSDISSVTDFDVYDVRAPSNDPNPPETYLAWLNSTAIRTKIGAQAPFQECADDPYNKFQSTGDDARSFEAVLNQVIQKGITTVVWAGDADWICNYKGGYNVVQTLQWPQSAAFASKALAPYTVAGQSKGQFKTVGNLSWLQVYAAGHEVPFYQPEAALQVFKQTMQKQPLSAT